MADPDYDDVRCTFCGKIYNLRNVEVIGRFADCSVFITPCCNKEADDRKWVSLPAFRRLIDEAPRMFRRPNKRARR